MDLIDRDELKKVLNIKPEDWNTPDERWRPESEFGKAIDAMPTIFVECAKCGTIKQPIAEPIKQTIEKFRDYQIEWLTAHFDIEFCEEEENLIIRFLKDTAECAIKFGMDGGEDD